MTRSLTEQKTNQLLKDRAYFIDRLNKFADSYKFVSAILISSPLYEFCNTVKYKNIFNIAPNFSSLSNTLLVIPLYLILSFKFLIKAPLISKKCYRRISVSLEF